MIVDFIKFIADSEGKLHKAVMNCTQFFFSVVLSIQLYRWMMGPVGTGEVSEWGVWIQWIGTGKVLVWLFIFLVSYALLFQFVSAFIIAFLVWFERKPWGMKRVPDDASKVTVKLLCVFGFLTYDKATDVASATRNTATLVEYLQNENRLEIGDVLEGLSSVVRDVWVLMVLFAGYCLGTDVWRHGVLDLFLAVFLIGIPWLYRCLKWLHRMLVEHAAELLFDIEGPNLNREIELALLRQGCPVSVRQVDGLNAKQRVFVHGGREYTFAFEWSEEQLTEERFDRFANTYMKERVYCVLFTNMGIDERTRAKVEAFGERLTVIVFQKVGQLPEMLQRVFPKRFPKTKTFQ